ncbi:tetratricopeptide repeat protein [Aporhodopirellula aestuarii]|uniref:Pentatricopeptide repeat-containing protein n=1 Tax=Aporhodopirellula aestuarii TaxID=2950107 RepID=A0ABT0U0B9_9BACT|nr:hypothetical protein [Aporhodopirellula aestuarii]MCM2370266.1 hypothetical protein [Aporhodopirellula aestuarii]
MSKTQKDKRSGRAVASTSANGTHENSVIPKRVISLISQENYVAAYDVIRALPRSPVTLQAMGVCAMRFGKAADAVNLFRSMAVSPGTTVLRSDIDDAVKINYATALMLAGLPSGALEILNELQDKSQPSAEKIRAAIKTWAAGLSFWRRLDWKLNGIDPPNSPVPIDFEPGVFPFVVPHVTESSLPLSAPSLPHSEPVQLSA